MSLYKGTKLVSGGAGAVTVTDITKEEFDKLPEEMKKGKFWNVIDDPAEDLSKFIKNTDFASADKAGIVKIGDGLNVDVDGVISVAGGSEEIEIINVVKNSQFSCFENSLIVGKVGKLVVVTLIGTSYNASSSAAIVAEKLPVPDQRFAVYKKVHSSPVIWYSNTTKQNISLIFEVDNTGRLIANTNTMAGTMTGGQINFELNTARAAFSYICE